MGYTCMISRDSALLHHACSGSPQICHRYKMEATHCHHTHATPARRVRWMSPFIRLWVCVCLHVSVLCNCYVITLPESAISNRFCCFQFFCRPLSCFYGWSFFCLHSPSPRFLSVLPLNLRISFLFHWHHCILFYRSLSQPTKYHWMLRCHVSIVIHFNFCQSLFFLFVLYFLVVIGAVAADAVTVVDNSPIMRLLARFSILCPRIKILLVYFQVVYGFAYKNHVVFYSCWAKWKWTEPKKSEQSQKRKPTKKYSEKWH